MAYAAGHKLLAVAPHHVNGRPVILGKQDVANVAGNVIWDGNWAPLRLQCDAVVSLKWVVAERIQSAGCELSVLDPDDPDHPSYHGLRGES